MFLSIIGWVAGHALRQAGSSPAGVVFSAGADMSHLGDKIDLLDAFPKRERSSVIRSGIWSQRSAYFFGDVLLGAGVAALSGSTSANVMARYGSDS